jgi:hypothetical protein
MLYPLPGPRNSCQYLPGITITYRLASRALFDTWGTNLQNVNKAMRRIYHARSGYKFLNVDQAGAEALIVAMLCLPAKYRQLFEYGVKPHVFVALHLFHDVWHKHLPDVVSAALKSEVKDLKSIPGWQDLDTLIKSSDDWETRYYYIGKKLCHSSNYGQGANRFILTVLEETDGTVVLDKKTAEHYLQQYHDLFPEIKAWQQKTITMLKRDKMLRNLFGFPRLMTRELDDSEEREWISFVPQSTVASITNIAFTKMQNYIEDNNLDWHLQATTHDSYTAEVPDNDVRDAAIKMIEYMTPELTAPDGTRFKMKAECQVGQNWSGYKKDKNPEGLKEYTLQ